MAYTKYHDPWADADSATGGGDESTPLVAAALDHIEAGIEAAADTADAAIPAPSSPAAHDGLFWNGSAWVADSITDAKIDAEADISVSKLAAGTEGYALKTVSGVPSWAVPAGYEFNVASVTADVTISATAEASSTTIVTSGAVSYDGATTVIIEFFCPRLLTGTGATAAIVFSLWDGSSQVSRFGVIQAPNIASASVITPVFLRMRVTPSAASHTYSVRGFRTVGDGTAFAGPGTGGAGINPPILLRQVKA